MTQRQAGSIKNKIVATELLEERAKRNFDQKELKLITFNMPDEIDAKWNRVVSDMETDPELALTHEYYEMTREEIQLMWMKKLNHLYFKKDRDFYFKTRHSVQFEWHLLHQGEMPIGLHSIMFTQSIDQFSNEE